MNLNKSRIITFLQVERPALGNQATFLGGKFFPQKQRGKRGEIDEFLVIVIEHLQPLLLCFLPVGGLLRGPVGVREGKRESERKRQKWHTRPKKRKKIKKGRAVLQPKP